MERKSVVDTRTPSSKTALFVEASATGSTTGIIERQEAAGQCSFVNSETLPVKMGKGEKEILEKCGIKFLGPVEGDEIFQFVELPAGWKKVPTSHSMWSHLVDEKNRHRASIFYKAAFYDRNAHMSLERRYTYIFDYAKFENECVGVAQVLDGQDVIYTTKPIPVVPGIPRYEISDKARELAEAFLDNNFPQWRDCAAYWD